MKVHHKLVAGAILGLVVTPAFADTFAGKVAYKNADGDIVSKSGEVELSDDQIDQVKLRIEGVENLADKVKVRTFEADNRKVVLAVFRDIRDMPAGSAVILKGTVLEGNNGKLFYGDVFTRSCKAESSRSSADQDQHESAFLERLLAGIESIQDLTGCASEYRGGILLARATDEGSQQEQQAQQD